MKTVVSFTYIVCFNTYVTGECIGKSRPFSYKAFEEGKIKVLGLPFPLKRPAAYGSAALRQILDAADTISVIGITLFHW